MLLPKPHPSSPHHSALKGEQKICTHYTLTQKCKSHHSSASGTEDVWVGGPAANQATERGSIAGTVMTSRLVEVLSLWSFGFFCIVVLHAWVTQKENKLRTVIFALVLASTVSLFSSCQRFLTNKFPL